MKKEAPFFFPLSFDFLLIENGALWPPLPLLFPCFYADSLGEDGDPLAFPRTHARTCTAGLSLLTCNGSTSSRRCGKSEQPHQKAALLTVFRIKEGQTDVLNGPELRLSERAPMRWRDG